ncbi:MAG: ABC transporter ATP-binding protein [Mycobacteriales bacterium]|nr:ABC transporter ATP-binding protein [Mycobacteriales bacterium]
MTAVQTGPAGTPGDGDAPPAGRPGTAFVEVRDLVVHFPTEDGLVRAVDGLSFSVDKGETLAIVGESGSGKSVTSLAMLGLQKGTSATLGGQAWVGDKDIVAASREDVRHMRGSRMAMIFQDPLSALHPYFTVGSQIAEAYRVHNNVSRKAANTRAVEMLERVGIPTPDKRAKNYPHELSGGMRQRAMIAMALSNNPELLIADEPTTALDVTVQAQILDLIGDLQKEFGSAVILITHDLGVVAEVATKVLVMYAGRALETGTSRDIFYRPEHPYTWGLLQSVTRLDRIKQDRLNPIAGSPPSLINAPKGCVFQPRCPYRDRPGELAITERPALLEAAPGHFAACHLPAPERRQIFETEVRPKL